MLLSKRHLTAELMDQPDLPPDELANALSGLRRINILSRSSRALWNEILPLLTRSSKQEIKLLDIACGGGEIAIELKQRAERLGLPLIVSGCDVNPHTIRYAQACAKEAGVEVSFFQHDSLQDPLPDGFDVLTCSLFLHHLRDAEVERLLRSMKKVSPRLVVISDLRRSCIGYWLAVVVTRLCTRSKVVHFDGPCSVRNAFSPAELFAHAESAAMAGCRLRRYWPFRMMLVWSRT